MDSTRCKNVNCQCTHTDGCERGFIWVRYKETKVVRQNDEEKTIEIWRDGVKFCPVCDPIRAHIQDTSRSPEEMAERLRARSSLKHAENYEKQDEAKTKVL